MSSNTSLAARLLTAELVKVNELRALLYDENEANGGTDRAHSRNSKSSSEKSNSTRRFRKISKILLEFSASTCLLDLFAVEQEDQSGRIETPRSYLFNGLICVPVWRFKLIRESDWGRRARRKLWPYFCYLLWFACTLHLSYNTYHQYAYDYYLFRLSRVRWLNQTQPPEVLRSYSGLEREDFLLEELRRRRDELKRIGAPNMELSFVVQCTYIHIIITSFVLYFVALIYFSCKCPFDFYFVRNIFSYDQEQRRVERFVQAQADKLANSIGRWSLELHKSGVITHDGKLVSSCGSGLIDCATASDSLLCKQLNEMLAAGLLRPLNQRARWVETWSVYYTWMMMMTYSYAIATSATIIWLLLGSLSTPPSERTARNWLIYFDLTYLLITISLSVSIYASTLVFTCWDQATLVNKLRKLLALTVELNNLRFYGRKMVADCKTQLAQSIATREYSSDTTRLVNRDILLVLMHYRISFAQLVKLKRPLGFIAATAVVVMFMTPLLGRIHVPYFRMDSMPITRRLLVMESLLIILPANAYLVPVCYLNKRCVDLYCELNSLLAHVTQISQTTGANQFNEHLTHDRHIIISLLRKELSHHDQVTRQLAIRIFGLSFTYNTLVRLHFYVGFIVLTMMGENLAQIKELTGTIFTDPLGLF